MKLDARTVSRLLAQSPHPLGWRDLVARLGVDGAARRDLRRLLRGMLRAGELRQDQRGAYHLPDGAGDRRGVLEASGAGLTFAGLPVERERRMVLRAGDEVLARVIGDEVHVLEVLQRSDRPLIGVTRLRGRYPYVESLSPDYRGRISLVNPEAVEADGETVAVTIVAEERRGLTGRIVEHLGGAGGAAQAAVTLLAAHGVPTEWDPSVDAQARRLPRQVHAGRHRDRRDLSDVPLVTIDGVTAQDFDDAVFAERRRGGWRLVVAIADVAQYVKTGSALDRAARERGNSVYLPDRVIPMLPEVLSNGLCSLNPQVPRLAMVCDMQVSRAGRVTRFEFYEALIRSWERLTYERVQEFLDEGALDVAPEVSASLNALQAVYQALRSAREARGALDFETHEARLELKNGRVRAIHPVHRLASHKLIEEAMIAANVSAAMFIEDRAGPGQALYRVHEPPEAEKLQQLGQALALAGVRLPRGDVTPGAVKAALDSLAGRPNGWLYELLVLRSLTQAVYTPENRGHFGLALERYMHFTSPIRRYADLVVHRTIKALLRGEEPPYPPEELLVIGGQISATERRAETVAWGVDAWLKCEYVAERLGDEFDGVIMGVTDFGLFVELKGFFVQGLLHVSELGTDYFQYQPQALALVGERSGRRFRLGDELRVLLADATPEQGRLDLRLTASPGGGRTDSAKAERQAKSGRKGGLRRQRPRQTGRRGRRG